MLICKKEKNEFVIYRGGLIVMSDFRIYFSFIIQYSYFNLCQKFYELLYEINYTIVELKITIFVSFFLIIDALKLLESSDEYESSDQEMVTNETSSLIQRKSRIMEV